MPDTAAVTGPKTPPSRGADVALSSEIKSTPIAGGTAAVNENVGILGVKCVSLLWFSYSAIQLFTFTQSQEYQPMDLAGCRGLHGMRRHYDT